MMEALSLEAETTKPNRDKCKTSTLTPTPKAVLMVVMVDRVEAVAAMVDKEEVAGVNDGTDIQSRV